MTAQNHPSFGRPKDPTVKVWRYMDRAKYESMLQTGSLYFQRADKFRDSLEGQFTKMNPGIEDQWIAHQIANYGFGAKPGSEDMLRAQYRRMLAVPHEDRQETYVNCWHMSELESPAMWKEYTSDNEAVCIRTTFQILQELLPDQCFLGGVRYIDYNNDFIDPSNSVNPIGHKHVSYKHEREIRAVIWGKQNAAQFIPVGEFGKSVPIKLDQLVEAIYVSTNASADCERKIGALAHSVGITAPVIRSNIAI
jgi:hypothetical protein